MNVISNSFYTNRRDNEIHASFVLDGGSKDKEKRGAIFTVYDG